MRRVAFILQLAMALCVSGRAMAVTAVWSEEASGPVSANWKRPLDDADGVLANLIDTTTIPGIWIIPAGSSSTTGMAWTNADGDEACCPGAQPVVSPTHGLSSWTFETVYEIKGPAIPQNDPTFESYPFAVSVGAFTHAPMDLHDGLSPGDSFYQLKTSEAGESIITEVAGPAGSRGVFHTARMIHDAVANEQRLYIDGVLRSTVDITGVGPFAGGIFTRSLYVRQYSQGGGFDPFLEVHIDYMRVASGVHEPGVEITAAVPEPATGLLALVGGAFAFYGRRRQS